QSLRQTGVSQALITGDDGCFADGERVNLSACTSGSQLAGQIQHIAFRIGQNIFVAVDLELIVTAQLNQLLQSFVTRGNSSLVGFQLGSQQISRLFGRSVGREQVVSVDALLAQFFLGTVS